MRPDIYLSDFYDENKCLATFMHYIDRTKVWVRHHDGVLGAAAVSVLLHVIYAGGRSDEDRLPLHLYVHLVLSASGE